MGVQRYLEIQNPPKRYAVIDLAELTALCGFAELGDFQRTHRRWLEEALGVKAEVRNDRWSEAIAVGSLAFVETVTQIVEANTNNGLPASPTLKRRTIK